MYKCAISDLFTDNYIGNATFNKFAKHSVAWFSEAPGNTRLLRFRTNRIITQYGV